LAPRRLGLQSLEQVSVAFQGDANPLAPSEFERLFKPVREVEKKMGVEQWKFSEQGETLENTSLLAHSPYYQEWRAAVQGVFDAVAKQAHSSANQIAGNSKHRLVVIVLPRSVPVKKEAV